ncbi:uncharacterized protein KZ484_017773 [Pholidichthys leucotaenia]
MLANLDFTCDSGVFCVFNESCTVPCDFQVGDDILIHWYKVEPGNQKQLNVHSYYYGQDQLDKQNQEFTGRTSLFKKEISEGNASLLLTGVRVQDEGRYKCYSSTKKEGGPLFINLKVDALIHKVTIKQEGKTITCSSDLIYPEPKLTWSIRPPSKISLDNVTQVHQNKEQKLYNISGSLTLADSDDDDDDGLVSSCTISSRANRWTAAARKQTFSSETTIPCTIPSISIKGFSLTWWFNQSQMIVNQTWTAVNWKRHTPNISESGDLVLQDLSSNQVGTYTCKLSSAVETITTDSALKKKKDHPAIRGDIIGGVIGATVAAAAIITLILWKKGCFSCPSRNERREPNGGQRESVALADNPGAEAARTDEGHPDAADALLGPNE